MRRTIYLMMTVGALGASALAGEVFSSITVDGKIYRDAKFGAVNQGKVVMFHSQGMTFVAVEKLPDYVRAQERLSAPAVPPVAPVQPAPSQPAQIASRRDTVTPPPDRAPYRAVEVKDTELAAFHRAQATMVVLNGQLVNRSTLIELTGFLTVVKISGVTGKTGRWFIELAVITKDVPKQLELRPSLWTRTGECVFLKGYRPDDLAEACGLVRTYGREIQKFNGLRAFEVGLPPTFEQWKQLHAGNY